MALKASVINKRLLNVQGIEQFIEKFIERKLKESRIEERIAELRKALHLDKKAAYKAAAGGPAVPPPRTSAPKLVLASVPESRAKEAAASTAKVSKPKVAPKLKAVKAPKRAASMSPETDPLTQLLEALDSHPKKSALLQAGKQKDQLLRSLIPLYVGQSLDVEVSSGTMSKFWSTQGVTYAAPNAAKALREHEGFAKRNENGVHITPAGVKYVDDALKA